MKAKVYQYGSYPRNNQIVSHQMEIDQLDGRIYICLVEAHESNSAFDILSIVVNLGDDFFVIDQCSRQSITRPENLELVKNVVADYQSHVMGKIEKNQHISVMDMKIFEMMDKDLSPLIEYRKRKEEERAIKEEERKRQMLEKKQRAADVEQKRLAKIKEQYISGEKISGEDFATICRKDGIDIHIRTIGTLNNSVSELNRNGIIYIWKRRGKAKPSTDGVRKLIKEYNAILLKKE